MRTFLTIIRSPVTHFNVLLVGFLILISAIHNHAHYSMEVDADSYVRAFCKKNPDTCKTFIKDDY
jgi:hypothetical protein